MMPNKLFGNTQNILVCVPSYVIRLKVGLQLRVFQTHMYAWKILNLCRFYFVFRGTCSSECLNKNK